MKTSLTSLGNKIVLIGSVAVMLSVTDPWYARGLMEKSGVSLLRSDQTVAVAILIAAAVAGGIAISREIGKRKGKKGTGMERFLILAASAVAVGLVVFRALDPPSVAETIEKMMIPASGDIFDFTTESIHVEVSRQWGQWLAIAGAAILVLGNLLRFGGEILQGKGGEAGSTSGKSEVSGMTGATPTA